MRVASFLRGALLACILAASAASASFAQAPRIAAVVNDDVITTTDLGARINLALVTTGLPATDDSRRQIAPQVLRNYIDETLQVQEAKRLNIQVSDEEVTRALTSVAQRNNMTLDQLAQALGQRGVEFATLQNQIRSQIAWVKLVQAQLRPKVVITDDQVSLAMKESAGQQNTEFLMSEILLPVYDPSQQQKVLSDANQLVGALRGGADFAALARQVSVASSAEKGGDLGWVSSSAMVPELRGQIASLQPGQMTDPLPSPAGVHIFLVRDKRAQAADAGANSDTTRQRLQQEQLERLAARYLRNLRKDAFIDVRL